MEELSAYLASGHLDGALALFRWALLALVPLLVLRAIFHFAPYRVWHRVRLMLFPLLFCAGALAILAYQSTWQLFGFTHPDFVQFIERFNPREDNAANHLIRGSILDRNGAVLAYTDPGGTGVRFYPWEEATAHVVGYRHPRDGLTGIEGAADATLSGYRQLETAADFKDALRTAMQRDRHVGTNVTLTVALGLQLAARALFDGRRGAAVALDPRTGEVLLAFSSPSFDPNVYDRRRLVDPESPMLNRALHGSYPPGSTFKTAIAALMAQTGVQQVLPCPAEGYRPPGARRPIRDHEYYAYERRGLAWPGFGTLDLDTALAKSSNSYFAHGGVLAGPPAFNDMAEKLHFNDRLVLYSNGLSRVSARPGHIPRLGRAEKRELAQLSIGQGTLLATPLHMCMLAAAAAAHVHARRRGRERRRPHAPAPVARRGALAPRPPLLGRRRAPREARDAPRRPDRHREEGRPARARRVRQDRHRAEPARRRPRVVRLLRADGRSGDRDRRRRRKRRLRLRGGAPDRRRPPPAAFLPRAMNQDPDTTP